MLKLLQETNAYKIIQKEEQTDLLSHAYLIVIDDARNLRFFLKQFAKLLLKAKENTRESALIDKECFSDCIILPQQDKMFMSADAVTVIEESVVKPLEGEKKLFILDNFQTANPSAQNKLLKVLEEPPQGVCFLIGATSDYGILPTVKSRVKKLIIPPFSQMQLTNCLKRLYPTSLGQEGYAAAGNGSLGKAQDLMEKGEYNALIQTAIECVDEKEEQIPLLALKLANIVEKTEFLAVYRLIFRDMLFYRQGKEGLLTEQKEQIKMLAKRYSDAEIFYSLSQIAETEKDIKFNGNFCQSIEICMMKIQKEKDRCKKLSE